MNRRTTGSCNTVSLTSSTHEVCTSESLSINVILSAYGSHVCALDPYAYCQAAKRSSVGSFLPLHPAREFRDSHDRCYG